MRHAEKHGRVSTMDEITPDMKDHFPACQHWRLERDGDDILWLFLDRQGESVNALSAEVLHELDVIIGYAEQYLPAGIAILSGKTTGFILGADVREFGGFTDADQVTSSIKEVHSMFSRLEALRCPTVAAFEGYCLGGGLELALSCTYRIARDIPASPIVSSRLIASEAPVSGVGAAITVEASPKGKERRQKFVQTGLQGSGLNGGVVDGLTTMGRFSL
jgi:hypothetical protein